MPSLPTATDRPAPPQLATQLAAPRRWLAVGALCGLLAVLLGAFGAHGLEGQITPRLLANWHTAADYLGRHALAIGGCGLWLLVRPGSRLVAGAALAFLIGVLLFSGSLFVMALSGLRLLGAVTPLGGVALCIGWGLLVAAAWRLKPVSPGSAVCD